MHSEFLNFTLKATNNKYSVYLRRNVELFSSGQRRIVKAGLKEFSGETFCITVISVQEKHRKGSFLTTLLHTKLF